MMPIPPMMVATAIAQTADEHLLLEEPEEEW